MKDQLETSVTEIDELCFKLFLKEQFDIYSFVCWLDGGLAQIKTGNRGEQLAWLCLKVRKIQLFLVFMRIVFMLSSNSARKRISKNISQNVKLMYVFFFLNGVIPNIFDILQFGSTAGKSCISGFLMTVL